MLYITTFYENFASTYYNLLDALYLRFYFSIQYISSIVVLAHPAGFFTVLK